MLGERDYGDNCHGTSYPWNPKHELDASKTTLLNRSKRILVKNSNDQALGMSDQGHHFELPHWQQHQTEAMTRTSFLDYPPCPKCYSDELVSRDQIKKSTATKRTEDNSNNERQTLMLWQSRLMQFTGQNKRSAGRKKVIPTGHMQGQEICNDPMQNAWLKQEISPPKTKP